MKIIDKDLITKVIELSRKYNCKSIINIYFNYESRLQSRNLTYRNDNSFSKETSVHAYNVLERYLKKKYQY